MPLVPSLVGGRLCLDFCNTMRGSERTDDNDYLTAYPDLIAWGEQAELIGPTEAKRILADAAKDAACAERALLAARRLREAMFRAFLAEAEGRGAAERDLAEINRVLAEGNARRKLQPAVKGACWAWDEVPASLDAILWPIAWSAGELLTSSQLERVKRCDGCLWLFHDGSRNRSRRWCDMRDCGNVAKVRRHRAKG